MYAAKDYTAGSSISPQIVNKAGINPFSII